VAAGAIHPRRARTHAPAPPAMSSRRAGSRDGLQGRLKVVAQQVQLPDVAVLRVCHEHPEPTLRVNPHL